MEPHPDSRGSRGSRSRVGSPLWMGDVARLLRENFAAGPSSVWLLTVTAPGAQFFPCSPKTCGHKGPHPQRSADGCRADEKAARDWNRTCSKRWSELHRQARQRVRREGHDLTFIARVFQMQSRGLLHVHVVVGYESEVEQLAAWAYRRALKELAPGLGFGNVDGRNIGDGSTVMRRERAAGYLSTYLGNGAVAAESSQFVQAVRSRMVPRPVYVSRKLTTMTRCTMRNLRRVRFLWWIRQGRSIFALAGRLPKWMANPVEYAAVAALLEPASAQGP